MPPRGADAGARPAQRRSIEEAVTAAIAGACVCVVVALLYVGAALLDQTRAGDDERRERDE